MDLESARKLLLPRPPIQHLTKEEDACFKASQDEMKRLIDQYTRSPSRDSASLGGLAFTTNVMIGNIGHDLYKSCIDRIKNSKER